ncbi:MULTISPECIES: DUF4124 domain-containing protein [Pseudomonas]|uniref:DUF4124 domain-containing protein n=1 Tax=Pseudomonas phytophila TaxID=2867264 RepID=A0ABY6FEZ1_9PSED|nr:MULTISPECIES: DUF4124 domain-containing protein [Pseudomonas]MDU8361546.1 DUF4124 domain-containing protein [Pseudomonas syringae group sp. J309-1]UXZ96488.1 DUF4124 domain-containing protein [Pseudomonas phytophila]
MTKPRLVCLLLSLVISPFAAIQAADAPQPLLYRYVDSRGVTVLDRQGVPPEYVAKGYEVLNAQGRVVQVVPPPPTADEINQAQAKKAQASADAQLLNLYSNVEDVDRAKARKLSELDALIALAQGNLKGLDTQQASLQGQAADLERAGKPVPQSLIDQMGDLRDQQHDLDLNIQRYQQARAQAEAAFTQDRARIQRLTAP